MRPSTCLWGVGRLLGGPSDVEGYSPPPQVRASGGARPPTTPPTAAAGHIRQCCRGQDEGWGCPTPQFLHLHPGNGDHHHGAPVAHHSGNQSHKCTRSDTIGGRRATKPNDLHVSSPSTTIPHVTVQSPHPPQTTEVTRTTGAPAPSGAGTPRSPRRERASKRAAQRHQPQHHTPTAVGEHQASPAGRENMPCHTNTATAGARPEQSLGTMRQQKGPGSGPAGNPGPHPQTPPDTSTRGHRPAAPTGAHLEPHQHHSPPV